MGQNGRMQQVGEMEVMGKQSPLGGGKRSRWSGWGGEPGGEGSRVGGGQNEGVREMGVGRGGEVERWSRWRRMEW